MLMLCSFALLPHTLMSPPPRAAGAAGDGGTVGADGCACRVSQATAGAALGVDARATLEPASGAIAGIADGPAWTCELAVAGVLACCAGRSAAMGSATPSTITAAASEARCERAPRLRDRK